MLAKIGFCVSLIIGAVAVHAAENAQESDLPNESEIRNLLAERIEALGGEQGGVGMVIGVIAPEGRHIISAGRRSSAHSRAPNGDTVFEIGSITKAFTALLLADMAVKNDLALNDPVAKYLPAEFNVPIRNGKTISLLDLATHTSGLPFMPNESTTFSDSGAANYSVTDLRHFIANCELRSDIGEKWEYSNVGYWLLGEGLAGRAGVDYETLLQQRVIAPLGLMNTAFALSPKMKTNFAPGHDAVLQPSPPMSTLTIYSIMPAAGGLYSTANDLLKLLAVAMDYEHSSLSAATHLTQTTHRPISSNRSAQGLGWTIIHEKNAELIVHDGGTLGYASSIAWDPAKRVGVVVLSNQVTNVGDIARHLLRPSFPLEKPTATKRTEITLDRATLDAYVGNYEAGGEGIFQVFREGDSLAIRAPAEWGLPKFRLHPENRQNFFVTELPMRVAFHFESDGSVKKILVYPPRGQRPIQAVRITNPRQPSDPTNRAQNEFRAQRRFRQAVTCRVSPVLKIRCAAREEFLYS
jgi:D-alanyl-D-alanine-carboxypeptidase/D-alanyl-D-alanine-endopeptidase